MTSRILSGLSIAALCFCVIACFVLVLSSSLRDAEAQSCYGTNRCEVWVRPGFQCATLFCQYSTGGRNCDIQECKSIPSSCNGGSFNQNPVCVSGNQSAQ